VKKTSLTADRFPMEIPSGREGRTTYRLPGDKMDRTGKYPLPRMGEARTLADTVNKIRIEKDPGNKTVTAGDLYAAGIIYAIYRLICRKYTDEIVPGVFLDAEKMIQGKITPGGADRVYSVLQAEFPPGTASGSEADKWRETPEKDRLTREMLFLHLFNINPALENHRDLFSDTLLHEKTEYARAIDIIENYFLTQPVFGPEKLTLYRLLKRPMELSPHDLKGQLQYMLENWGDLIGDYLIKVLGGIDLINEETKPRFFGPGEPQAPGYRYFDDRARYSPDSHWMPRVVLIAKSTLVWLDQLSKKHGRTINRLDEIPDEELDLLAARGFNSLWLIGLWERSPASRRIKMICGNPEAEASAYSLMNYEISWTVGGWDAMRQLDNRCRERGIRLASDMVPNHTGIDSDWLKNTPDRFLQLPYSPYPQYTFNGENLSGDPNLGVYLEDHYYSKNDAAVVFKRVDFRTGDTRFIYHGNDGTSMPWNDTAQINFLNPEAREAVIQQILHVARNFSVIRFDAAMTLAKAHIQRLWFPAPGRGGDIPTRSENGMTDEEFDRLIPNEFWRDVVERIAAEAPDTLLLAEAFWMMEGYFVRNLGMHRVYNSAFMNMTKTERNQEFRETIIGILSYDPEILKRFVNFMNNPDEDTAIAQFGNGDKYFCICTLMATLPGLPMFGHGQIEGFTEKYGMEYRKAYYDEKPDETLVRRHEQEIFPLLHHRYLFAEASAFQFYDFWTVNHAVNGNVYAYSNQSGGEKALVAINNSYEKTSGWIKYSVPKGSAAVVTDLANSFGFQNRDDAYALFRETRSNLWYIRKSRDLFSGGFFFELNGYQNQVFLDIHEVLDTGSGWYHQLFGELGGRGVADPQKEIILIRLRPVFNVLSQLVNDALFEKWNKNLKLTKQDLSPGFLALGHHFNRRATDIDKELALAETRLTAVGKLASSDKTTLFRIGAWLSVLIDSIQQLTGSDPVRDWFLSERLPVFMPVTFKDAEELPPITEILAFRTENPGWSLRLTARSTTEEIFRELFLHREFRERIGVNLYDGILWFNKESLEKTLSLMLVTARIDVVSQKPGLEKVLTKLKRECLAASEKSGYKVEEFFTRLKKSPGVVDVKPVKR
jgi:glycosidase